jgi:hypothetical protein
VYGSQALAVSLEPDGIGLRLQARIDATSTPLVEIPVEVPPGCDIGRVTLREDDLALSDAGARVPLDIQWSMTEATRMTVVMQQPRAGRYRLEVDGRLPVRPASRGRVPLLRAELAGSAPLAVAWSRGPQAVTERAEVPPGAIGPEYDLGEEAGPEPAPADAAAPAEPPIDRVDSVERMLVTAAIDDRGRLRGIVRYDVVAARSTIRLRLPARSRIFDVLVDGQDVDARPVATDAWEVELHDAAWPRSIMVVFSGDLDPALGAGQPIELLPPMIEDVPCGEVLWKIDAPAGRMLRVAEPARQLDEQAWQAALDAARDRIDAAFSRALVAAGPDADRLRSFAAARAAGTATNLERGWADAIGTPTDTLPVRVASGGDGGVTVRVVRAPVASSATRPAATIGLAAIAAWGWLASRRRGLTWDGLRPAAAWCVPALLVVGGSGWAAMLAPALPGWLMVAAGAALFAAWMQSLRAAASTAAGDARPEYPSTRSLGRS